MANDLDAFLRGEGSNDLDAFLRGEDQPKDDRWEITKGLAAGVDQLQAMGGGLVAAAGDAIGSEGLTQWGLDTYQQNMQEAQANRGAVSEFTDIGSHRGILQDSIDWGLYTIGQVAPTLVTSIAGGGVGGIAAKTLAKRVATKAAEKALARTRDALIAKGVKGEIAEQAALRVSQQVVNEVTRRAATTGALVGAGATSVGLETGNAMGQIYDETGQLRSDVALAHGAVGGALDALPVTRILNRVGLGNTFKQSVQKSLPKELVTQALFEGGTEGLQNLIEQHAVHWVKTDGESLLSRPELIDTKAMINEAAAGMLGGTVMSAASYPFQGEAQADPVDPEQAMLAQLKGYEDAVSTRDKELTQVQRDYKQALANGGGLEAVQEYEAKIKEAKQNAQLARDNLNKIKTEQLDAPTVAPLYDARGIIARHRQPRMETVGTGSLDPANPEASAPENQPAPRPYRTVADILAEQREATAEQQELDQLADYERELNLDEQRALSADQGRAQGLFRGQALDEQPAGMTAEQGAYFDEQRYRQLKAQPAHRLSALDKRVIAEYESQAPQIETAPGGYRTRPDDVQANREQTIADLRQQQGSKTRLPRAQVLGEEQSGMNAEQRAYSESQRDQVRYDTLKAAPPHQLTSLDRRWMQRFEQQHQRDVQLEIAGQSNARPDTPRPIVLSAEEQQAQDAADRQELIRVQRATAARKQYNSQPDPAEDSLWDALAKLGGLNRQIAEQEGIDPAEFKSARAGIRYLFPANGGMSFDEATEALAQEGMGWVSDIEDFRAKLRDSLSGRHHYAPEGVITQAERELEERAMQLAEQEQLDAQTAVDTLDVDQFDAEATAHEAALMLTIADMARYNVTPEQVTAIYEQHQGDSARITIELAKLAMEFENAQSETGRGIEGSGQADPQAQADGEQIPGLQPETGGITGADADALWDELYREAGLQQDEQLLSSYSEQDLRDREQEADFRARVADAKQREADNKAKADAEVGSFALAGSTAEADVAASRGQNDLFGASPRTPSDQPANPVSAETDTAPSEGEASIDSRFIEGQVPTPSAIGETVYYISSGRKSAMRTLRVRYLERTYGAANGMGQREPSIAERDYHVKNLSRDYQEAKRKALASVGSKEKVYSYGEQVLNDYGEGESQRVYSGDVFEFGKNRGATTEQVISDDPGYIDWLMEQEWFLEEEKFGLMRAELQKKGYDIEAAKKARADRITQQEADRQAEDAQREKQAERNEELAYLFMGIDFEFAVDMGRKLHRGDSPSAFSQGQVSGMRKTYAKHKTNRARVNSKAYKDAAAEFDKRWAELSGEPASTDSIDFNTVVRVAADSVEQLRPQDVDRVMGTLIESDESQLFKFAGWLKQQRPDLTEQVDENLTELAALIAGDDTPVARLAKAWDEAHGYDAKRKQLRDELGDLMGAQLQAGENRYAIILPDATEPGRVRVSYYDQRGFSGHSVYDTEEQAFNESYRDGYRNKADTSLEDLAATRSWADGSDLTAKIQAVNSGQMTYDEFLADQAKDTSSYIFKANGEPFGTERSAEASAKQKQRRGDFSGYTIEAVEGGFAIAPTSDAAADKGTDLAADGPNLAADQEPTKQAPAAKIEDSGERLEGARKYTQSLREAVEAEIDTKNEPLSKSFPIPDYEKLAASGVDPRALAYIAQVRGEIKAKPRRPGAKARWGKDVDALRFVAARLLNGEMTYERAIKNLSEADSYVKHMPDVFELAKDILPSQIKDLAPFKLNYAHYTIFNGKRNVDIWEVTDTSKKGGFGGMNNLAHFESKEQALDYIKGKVTTVSDEGKPLAKFDVWKERGKDGYFVGKKIASRKYVELKSGFETSAEARQYIKDHNDELVEQLKAKKKMGDFRRPNNNPRIGEDRRGGRDVSSDEFRETFGFRGVQFGNYVENAKRQEDLNNAYDGLMDLAELLGIPAQALSLNGELGLAFGARGHGGADPASAHYERGNMVINLTKNRGAGSLAHEWWHALDNYFGRMESESGTLVDGEDMATTQKRSRLKGEVVDNKYVTRETTDADFGMRREMYDAYQAVMDAIKSSKLPERSRAHDEARSKDYWSTNVEMSARAFERFVIDSLADNGNENDYLANVRAEDQWNADLHGPYPYPTDNEMGKLKPAYAGFFKAIKHKRTDQGVALYEDAALYSGYERESSKLQDRQHGVREPAPEQGVLNLVAPADVPADTSAQQARDNFRVRYVQAEAGTISTGLDSVNSPSEAAHVFAPIRKHAQETMLALVTDREGRVLNLIRHTKGGRDQSSVFIGDLVGAVAATDGAANVWFGHNHPTGDTTPSASDYQITDRLLLALDGAGIEVQGHVVVGSGQRADFFEAGNTSSEKVVIKPYPRKRKQPITERVLRKRRMGEAEQISSPEAATKVIESIESEHALLLLDNKNQVLGSLTLSADEMAALRRNGQVPRILRTLSETNASAIIIKSATESAAANVARFLNGLHSYRLLDALIGTDGQYTSSASGRLGIESSTGPFMSRKDLSRARPELDRSKAMLVAEVEAIAEQVMAGWEGKPAMMVYATESELPAVLRDEIEAANAQGETRGIYFNGVVHLVAARLHTAEQVETVLFHEALGHYGVDKLFGDNVRLALNALYLKLGGEGGIKRLAKRFKIDLSDYMGNAEHLDAAERREMIVHELLAHVAEQNIQPTAIDNLISLIKAALRKLGFNKLAAYRKNEVIQLVAAARKGVIEGTGKAKKGDRARLMIDSTRPRFSRTATADNFSDLDSDQTDFLNKIGPPTVVQKLRERIAELMDRAMLKTRQGLVDRFAALRELDQAARGENVVEEDTANSSWVLARMTAAADGALNALMNHGRIKLDGGVIDVDTEQQGLLDVLKELGDSAEIERFMGWVAANRADKLAQEGRENLFEPNEIEAGMRLNTGTLADGRQRSDAYAQTFEKFQAIRDDVLAIADQAGLLRKGMEDSDALLVLAKQHSIGTGLVKKWRKLESLYNRAEDAEEQELYGQKQARIEQELYELLAGELDDFDNQLEQLTTDQRELWANEFYVPFYRVLEEQDGVKGPRPTGGISRQEAYKKLKGGSQNLNDLLGNTLMNFHHLLSASLKNQAAKKAMQNAEAINVATATSENARDKKASTFVLINGVKQWYNISDPLVFEAMSSLGDAGMNSTAMRVMRAFKRVFTNFTTASPQFMAANLIRDSFQAVALADMKINPLTNAVRGVHAYGVWDKSKPTRAHMMATGGSFSFGHIFGDDTDAIKGEIDRELRGADVVRDASDVKRLLRAGWDWYHGISDSLENANRAAIYEHQLSKGRTKLQAAFAARDLMDFGAHGAWPAIRFLTGVVPFLNARLQGLDKIYRSGVKPTASVVRSLFPGADPASDTDKKAAARFSAVTGALTLATLALYMANKDDEEYEKLEDWQRDTYWFVRVGDNAFFIPKPFEVGAIATLAERSLQQLVDDKATGKLFAERMSHMLMDTFSFNPTPQLFAPLIDVYANRDSFTGRPIESVGQQRLSPSQRQHNSTSTLAKGLSKATEATFGEVFGKDSSLVLSPVQIDYLVGGYLGWLGERAVSTTDVVARTINGETTPHKRWSEYQPFRRFYRDLNLPGYTRYQTEFYDELRTVNQVYADINNLRKLGEHDAALELARENKDRLAYRKVMNRIQRQLSAINAQMKLIRRSDASAEEKRRRLDLLQVQKNRLTEMAAKRL